MSIERKLAAIMYTDIAEYTALSANDENKALKLLDNQKHILNPIIEEYNGILHKEIGDGFLLTFPTVTDAIMCGIKIHEETKAVADLNLRIGIHEGEITLKDGDIFGDDVNVVSRIHPFAPVGGIVITGKVQQDISSIPKYQTEYIGQPKLKGVSQKVEIFCITSHSLPKQKIINQVLDKTQRSSFNIFALSGGLLTIVGIAFWIWIGIFDLSFGGKEGIPSLSILMMDNIGNEENESWTRSLTHEIIEELNDISGIMVPEFDSIESLNLNLSLDSIYSVLGAEHIFRSSLEIDKNKYIVKYKIVNIKTKDIIESGKISKNDKDISLLVKTIVSEIIQIYKIKGGISNESIDPYHAEAYKLYMEGVDLISVRLGKMPSQDERMKAREKLSAAIQLDPDLKEAYIQLGWDYLNNNEYHNSRKIHKQLLSNSKERNDISGIHSALIMSATTNLKLGKYNTAEEEYKKSLTFATSHKKIKALYDLGIIYREQGQFDNSITVHIQALNTAIQENEYYYQGVSNHYLGESYFFFGKLNKALASFDSALDMWETLEDKPQEIWTQSWELLVLMELKKIRKSKNLLYEIENLLEKYKPHPSDRKIIYWNLYNASKKILETKNILSKLHLKKQPDYYLELAYNKLQTELDNIYLTPGERESLRNNVRLNKDIILEWNRVEKLKSKKNRQANRKRIG